MKPRGRRFVFFAAALVALTAAIWIIVPAFANQDDYGVRTGSTPQRLEPTATRVPPPTSTPVPPTPIPPTPVPPTPVPPTQDPNCKEGYYLQHAPDGSSGNCVPIGS